MTDSEGQERVSLTKCIRYHSQTIRLSMQQIFKPFGGISNLVKPGQKVLLKPNLLSAAQPSDAVTTHPLILKVVTELIAEAGGKVYIGDSPGSDSQLKAHRVCGIDQVIAEMGAEALIFTKNLNHEVKGTKKRTIQLAAELAEVDLVFNMAKLKTHSLTGMTAAVKNIYGCVFGLTKGRYHFENPMARDFSRFLIDVCLAVKPTFSIIDAVVAMEGAGPRKGRPRQLGLLMASTNPFALDTVAAAVTGFHPAEVTTLQAARELQLLGSELSAIQIEGLPLDEARVKDFDKGPVSSGKIGRLAALLPLARVRDLLIGRRPYPRVNSKLCTGCGVCYEHCPAQIIDFANSIPDLDLNGCIRCYCCQEFCPHGAIELFRR